MDQTETICNQIDAAIKSLTDLKNLITAKSINIVESPKVAESIVNAQSVVEAIAEPAVEPINDFESLKKALYSDKWPHAVNPSLICDSESESDKKERGVGILELVIEEPVKGKKFLDFGCGEGHCAAEAVGILDCAISVGYDVKEHANWTSTDKTKFSTSYDEVKKMGPYDAILVFDVIDHVFGESPESMMKKLSELLAPDGRIYMRCHPWMSRHGTHLYHKLNKAYAHLVFTDYELSQLSNHVPEVNIKVTHPLATYSKFFKESELKVLSDRKITEKVDPFFKVPKIAERIMKNTKKACKKFPEFKDFPEFQMGIQFVDYVLTK